MQSKAMITNSDRVLLLLLLVTLSYGITAESTEGRSRRGAFGTFRPETERCLAISLNLHTFQSMCEYWIREVPS